MLRHRKIVDIKFAALLLQLVKDVAGQAADDLTIREGCDGDEGVAAK
jgi:hypothetical protein